MKVKELVEKLNKYTEKYGEDLQVVISTDEEGNMYSTVEVGSLALVLDNPSMTSGKPIGVVIYPWEEGFYTAEEAIAGKKEEYYE